MTQSEHCDSDAPVEAPPRLALCLDCMQWWNADGGHTCPDGRDHLVALYDLTLAPLRSCRSMSQTDSGTWSGDVYRTADGRTFAITSEKARNEDRLYWGQQQAEDGAWTRILGTDGFDKRAVKRRVERWADEAS